MTQETAQEMTLQVTPPTASEAEPVDEQAMIAAQAAEKNARNAYCAVGCEGAAAPELLTMAQVRHMSRQEVRDNYAMIIESMKHWH